MHRIEHGVIVLMLVSLGSPASAQTFNLRHDLVGSVNNSGTAWGVEVMTDSTYAVICNGNYQDTLYYSSSVRCLVVNEEGMVVSEDRVEDVEHATYPGWSNSSSRRFDGGLLAGGSNFRTDSVGDWIQRPVLYFFDSAGVCVQHIPLGPDNESWIGRQGKQSPDGGYIICGETSSISGTETDAFVIKTDPQGNEEWTRTFGGPWNDYTVAVDMAPNAGYFLGGQLRVSSGNQELWVQCLNDTGGVVWDQVWGSPFDEPNAHITTAADGNVLVASSWAYGPNDLIKRYLAKLNAVDGEIIWEKEYAGQSYNYAVLNVVKEIEPNGDLICASRDLDSGQFSGVLLRTTNTGDSLWMRYYVYADTLVSNGDGLFNDVMPTPDGGFIAVGLALSVPGVYTADVWIVKTDSLGCIEPGCHLIQGMETQITNLRGALSVVPNPVAQGTAVQVLLDLPASFTPQGALRLTVTDAMGRLVQELQLSGSAGQLTTDNWQPGLYHIHLSDDTRWISGAKLVVE